MEQVEGPCLAIPFWERRHPYPSNHYRCLDHLHLSCSHMYLVRAGLQGHGGDTPGPQLHFIPQSGLLQYIKWNINPSPQIIYLSLRINEVHLWISTLYSIIYRSYFCGGMNYLCGNFINLHGKTSHLHGINRTLTCTNVMCPSTVHQYKVSLLQTPVMPQPLLQQTFSIHHSNHDWLHHWDKGYNYFFTPGVLCQEVLEITIHTEEAWESLISNLLRRQSSFFLFGTFWYVHIYPLLITTIHVLQNKHDQLVPMMSVSILRGCSSYPPFRWRYSINFDNCSWFAKW